jgi:hypothetical protein
VETPPAPSKADTLYPNTLCFQIIHNDASKIYCLGVELHCRHTQVIHMHTSAIHLPIEYSASAHTNELYKWKLNCGIEPSQNQQGDRSAAYKIQPGPYFRTSCKRCNSRVASQSQLTFSANTLPHTPLISYQSITISISCLFLQHVNLDHTNSHTLDGSHPVPHLLAHV